MQPQFPLTSSKLALGSTMNESSSSCSGGSFGSTVSIFIVSLFAPSIQTV